MPTVRYTKDQELLCKDGVIEEYLKFTQGHESPKDFHLWTVIGAIAMALGRDVYYEQGVQRLYPNHYIVFVGESALTHKSTAMKLLIKPLQEACPDMDFLSQKITPQAMISRMSKVFTRVRKSEVAIHASEMSVLLGKSNIDDTLLKVLTDFWDCSDKTSYETIARGEEVVNNVCVNILAGSTSQWLRNSVPADSLGAGFFSRIIFIQRPYTKVRIPFLDELFTPEKMLYLRNVVHDLKIIHNQICGEMIWTSEARERFRHWYMVENDIESAQDHMRGYLGRKGDMIIKLAMVHSASKRLTRHIKCEDIIFALTQLNKNEKFMDVLAMELGQTETGKKQLCVLDKIRSGELSDGRKGISRTNLMRKVKHIMKAQELDEIMYSLKESEVVQEVTMSNKRMYVYTGVSND